MSPEYKHAKFSTLLFLLPCFMLRLVSDTIEPPLPAFSSSYFPGPAPAVTFSEDTLLEPPVEQARVETKQTVPVEKVLIPPPVVVKPATSPAPEIVPQNTEKSVSATDAVESNTETDLYARPGDRFSIYLNRSPWLFTAIDPAGEGIRYEGRSREENGDRLIFTARDTGKYRLKFVLGTSSPDKAASEIRTVEVVEPEVFIQKIAGGVSASEERTGDAQLIQNDQKEASVWDTPEEAWEETLKNRTENSAACKDALAWFDRRYEKREDSKLLSYMYVLNFLNQSDPPESVVENLFSLTSEEQRTYLEDIDRLSEYLVQNEKTALLDSVINTMNDFNGLDLLIFKLGNEYERRENVEYYRKAAACYDQLITDFPLSRFWDQAHYRKNYIERHFLLVR